MSEMTLGSKVISKKTGLPGIGTIVGVQYAMHYAMSMQRSIHEFRRWNELYPEWINKLVFIVYYPIAQKQLSFDEWKNCNCPLGFYENIPSLHLMHYPSDDLELIKE